MKGLKVNMDMVNCGLLLVVLVLVVMCCVKREGFRNRRQLINKDSQLTYPKKRKSRGPGVNRGGRTLEQRMRERSKR